MERHCSIMTAWQTVQQPYMSQIAKRHSYHLNQPTKHWWEELAASKCTPKAEAPFSLNQSAMDRNTLWCLRMSYTFQRTRTI